MTTKEMVSSEQVRCLSIMLKVEGQRK